MIHFRLAALAALSLSAAALADPPTEWDTEESIAPCREAAKRVRETGDPDYLERFMRVNRYSAQDRRETLILCSGYVLGVADEAAGRVRPRKGRGISR